MQTQSAEGRACEQPRRGRPQSPSPPTYPHPITEVRMAMLAIHMAKPHAAGKSLVGFDNREIVRFPSFPGAQRVIDPAEAVAQREVRLAPTHLRLQFGKRFARGFKQLLRIVMAKASEYDAAVGKLSLHTAGQVKWTCRSASAITVSTSNSPEGINFW